MLAVAGLLAGGLTCALEAVLVRLLVGHWIPLGPFYVAFYLASGLAVAGLLAVASRALGRAIPGPTALLGSTLAGLQLAAGLERVQGVVALELSPVLGALAAIGAAVVFVAVITLAQRAVRRPLDGSLPAALAVVTAVGLALNRSLFDSFLQPEALLADAALGAVFVALVGVMRGGVPGFAVAGGCAAFLLGALILLGPASGSDGESRVPARAANPPVILFVVDTLREDVFRDVVETTGEGARFREKLEGSVWFSQHTSTAPWTVPSMGSIMTGRFPSEHGFHRTGNERRLRVQQLSPSVPTLAQQLAAEGYQGHGFVTNSHLDAGTGLERGLRRLEMLRGPTWKMPLLTLGERLRLVGPEPYRKAAEVAALVEKRLPGLVATGSPLFLWIHLMDPHEPLLRHGGLEEEPGKDALPEIDRLYRDEVRYTLQELVRIVTLLEEHGLWEDALVVFCSDHGEMLPSDRRSDRESMGQTEPGYGHGYALFDELVRVPLVIRLPQGRSLAREVDELVSQVDIVPTVLNALGIERRARTNGTSLLPWSR